MPNLPPYDLDDLDGKGILFSEKKERLDQYFRELIQHPFVNPPYFSPDQRLQNLQILIPGRLDHHKRRNILPLSTMTSVFSLTIVISKLSGVFGQIEGLN